MIAHNPYGKGIVFTSLRFWLWQDWDLAERITKEIIKDGYQVVSINHVLLGLYNVVYFQRKRND